MNMKLATFSLLTALVASPALAAGSHDGRHSHKNHEETDHKTPKSAAEHGHIDGHDHATDHAEMMESGMPSMADEVDRSIDVAMRETDDDPNSIRLKPGISGTVIWTFASTGTFEFACLIPGHYESGMHEPIEVAEAKTERTFTKGAVKKIKVDSGKVTIIHEELTELNMPAMTMVFQADDEIVGQLSEGEAVEFVA